MSAMHSRRRQEVDSLLRQAIPTDPRRHTRIDHIPPNYAQDVIDVAWDRLDDNPATATPPIHPELDLFGQTALLRRLCLKIAVNHDVLPGKFYVRGVICMSDEPIDAGGFADIYNGEYGGKIVIIKRPRISNEEEKEKIKMEFCRESLLWSKLNHPNVLSFLGISQDAFERSICMILPFMSRGSIRRRMTAQVPDVPANLVLTQDNFHSRVNTWLYEVSFGLAYLHSQGVVHGDLHGGNILIDDEDHVRLTDFGFALIAAAAPGAYGSKHGGASHHFMAPELWEPSDFGLTRARPTEACDVYAFGCTCIELYTGKVPFPEPKMTMYRISKKVLKGDRPTRPQTPPMPDSLWEVVQAAWTQQPQERLSSHDLERRMRAVMWRM
ncbi:hypothetical protein EUX98_g5008 [Antrodiella citrinella]|uniref:Protein kinase domain-containing protein n=1 Tax=Antrodiella citrinella TaxID=2447956 RepID=A0A4S4MUF3_9APHY|nr:hypothetical protein EUX98_g5008 [Antrodiella citrinella]